MEEERNYGNTELWTPERWGQKLLVLWKLNSLLLINAGQYWSCAWVCWSRCSSCINHSSFPVQYFNSNTNSTVKICQFENWCRKFLTFHSWMEVHHPPDCFTNSELSSQFWPVHSWHLDWVSAVLSPILVLLLPLHVVATEADILQLLSGTYLSNLVSLWGSPHCETTAIVSHRGVTDLNYICSKVLGGSLIKVISVWKLLQQNKLI